MRCCAARNGPLSVTVRLTVGVPGSLTLHVARLVLPRTLAVAATLTTPVDDLLMPSFTVSLPRAILALSTLRPDAVRVEPWEGVRAARARAGRDRGPLQHAHGDA